MCGILGLYSEKGIREVNYAFIKANQAAYHRGPDGSGVMYFKRERNQPIVYYDNEKLYQGEFLNDIFVALAHRRLSIIDLSVTGRQPMGHQNGKLWITYNGEIFNYIELRQELFQLGHTFTSTSDTEVILHAYQAWGDDCVQRFNGIWAFALFDIRKNRIFCSRDRFGVKPFHYYWDGHHFAFASEIKQLLEFPFIPRQVNEVTIYDYLAIGVLECGEDTFFRDINNLLPGYNLVFNLTEKSIQKSAYYQPKVDINNNITLIEAALTLNQLLTDSIKLQLRSDVEVGSCLSGGLDSSSIVCLMSQLLKHEGKSIQHTFSSHFEETEANELEYMQSAILTTGVQAHFTYPTGEELIDNLENIIWTQEEPFGSTSIFAQWSVFKLAHEAGIKVMLDGQGADEILAGYSTYLPYYYYELFQRKHFPDLLREMWQHNRLSGGMGLPSMQKVCNKIVSKFKRNSNSVNINWINSQFAEKFGEQSVYLTSLNVLPFERDEVLNNLLYQHTFINNLQQLLKYEDRDSMAFSVEARVPFLDHRIVEFVFSLPSSFKIRRGYQKWVLREAMKGVLPEKIRLRVNKLGFATPESKWMKTILRSYIENAIQYTGLRAYLIPSKAQQYADDVLSQGNIDFTLWRWVNMHLWLKTFALG